MKYLSIDLSPEERAAFGAAERKWRDRTAGACVLLYVAVALYLDAAFYWTEQMLMIAALASIPALVGIVALANRAGKYAGDRAVDRMRADTAN